MSSVLSLFYRSPVISRGCVFAKSIQHRTFCSGMTLDAFTKNEIVPDVVSRQPQHLIKVSFNSGVSVNLGNKLTPRQVKDQPTIDYDADANALYTLAMTDPDAPSRKEPTYREWEHWLVVNIPGKDVSQGDVLAEYIGSAPPSGSGFHRYVYLLYKQHGRISDPEHGHLPNNSAKKRGGFKIEEFAKKHCLEGPIAGNFYEAEWDDYVPEVYKRLSG
uniref:Phosphatidylethanolamine-binding protein n=1 Tax=Strongyloides papillosus TaxID=174720 RepID=A0A0N5CFC6_STREA